MPSSRDPEALTTMVPSGQRVRTPHADVVDEQRPEHGTGAAGERHDEREAESGGGAHGSADPPTERVPGHDERQPPATVAAR